ncbi:hypothetical protein SPBR_02276 [Sporothrix brasiliensis 5110]|uniref:Uncharacterized protein n=1 Tax=Sporothrix brasiliensis 5110 TaxID=1398154 RepID=A0A0C2J672_9PEZI|nr:uncharacterized protein SPBR_02276 [Sporothrix brasiliensis 5110]KIH92547.1 hypothetical protein SPBR_02276 [Sporothrix brasiliensis 5110]
MSNKMTNMFQAKYQGQLHLKTHENDTSLLLAQTALDSVWIEPDDSSSSTCMLASNSRRVVRQRTRHVHVLGLQHQHRRDLVHETRAHRLLRLGLRLRRLEQRVERHHGGAAATIGGCLGRRQLFHGQAQMLELGVLRPERLHGRRDAHACDGVAVARLVQAPADGGAQQRQHLGLADAVAAQVARHLGQLLRVVGQVARVRHHGQVERGCGQPRGAAVLDERVQEAVGRRVRCLAAVADGACRRGDGDEKVQRRVFQGTVEVPATAHLALDDLVVVFKGHLLKQNVAQHHGAMDDATHGRKTSQATGQELVHRLPVHHIALPDNHLRARLVGELVNECLDLARRRTRARHEDNVLGALAGHPPSHAAAEATRAANQDVRGIWAQEVGQLVLCCCGPHNVVGVGHNNKLACCTVVVAGVHSLERALDIGHREEGDGSSGSDFAVRQQASDVCEETPHDLGPLRSQSENVDRNVAGVAPVCLAHLQEAPRRRSTVTGCITRYNVQEPAKLVQRGPRFLGSVGAGESVEHNVDALAVGGVAHGAPKGRVSAVEDMVFGDVVLRDQKSLLLGAADCSKDLGTNHLCQADGGLTDGTRCCMHENGLAIGQAAKLDEAVVCRDKGQRQGSAGLKRHRSWQLKRKSRRRSGHCGERAAAHRVCLALGSDSNVMCIDTDGLDLDLNLVGCQRGASRRVIDKVHCVQSARMAERQLERAALGAKGCRLDDVGVEGRKFHRRLGPDGPAQTQHHVGIWVGRSAVGATHHPQTAFGGSEQCLERGELGLCQSRQKRTLELGKDDTNLVCDIHVVKRAQFWHAAGGLFECGRQAHGNQRLSRGPLAPLSRPLEPSIMGAMVKFSSVMSGSVESRSAVACRVTLADFSDATARAKSCVVQ